MASMEQGMSKTGSLLVTKNATYLNALGSFWMLDYAKLLGARENFWKLGLLNIECFKHSFVPLKSFQVHEKSS